MTKQIFFYKDKPVFGLDIGHGSLKAMQVRTKGKRPHLIGYGTAMFDGDAIQNGVLTKPDVIAKATKDLLRHGLVGKITTKRVAMAIPSYRAYSRSMQLPRLKEKELLEAVHLEAERYIPVPLNDLYLDFTITGESDTTYELLVVAVPKNIVDSYMKLAELVDLEPVLIEPTMASDARLFAQDKNSDVTSVIIDFGSMSADISIFDKTTLVTGTVPAGGLVFTNNIREKLKLSETEAAFIKTKYGIGVSKKQKEITEALEPTLQKIVMEIRRMTRYYEERYGTDRKIGQIIILGGGANMPGLGDYLTSTLRIPVRSYNPWNVLEHKHLHAPSNPDKSMYATVTGLGLLDPREVFV